MRNFFVVGNLKMNLTSREEATQYLSVFRREMQGRLPEAVTMIVCPPFPYLASFDHLPGNVKKGAQDMFWEKNGAYTGQVSPLMLKGEGVEYVIVGHSERRLYGGDTDEIVAAKTRLALKHLLIPIVCIGETAEERDRIDRVLMRQIRTVFEGLSKLQAEKIIIAYEPRWAIGTDRLPTTQEILQVKVFLRKLLTEMFDAGAAERIKVLYGGSVKSSFLPAVSWEAEMDGVLVGRESLFPYELVKMMQAFEEEARKEG